MLLTGEDAGAEVSFQRERAQNLAQRDSARFGRETESELGQKPIVDFPDPDDEAYSRALSPGVGRPQSRQRAPA
jgi:hypothetical protein